MGNARRMGITELMDRKIVGVTPVTTIKSALRLMEVSGVHLLPVISGGRLVGMVEDSDISTLAHVGKAKDSTTVQSVMRPPIFIDGSASVELATQKAVQYGLTRLPVVDSVETMRCIGIVSATALLEEAEARS